MLSPVVQESYVLLYQLDEYAELEEEHGEEHEEEHEGVHELEYELEHGPVEHGLPELVSYQERLIVLAVGLLVRIKCQ